jgi:hypothetical protein
MKNLSFLQDQFLAIYFPALGNVKDTIAFASIRPYEPLRGEFAGLVSASFGSAFLRARATPILALRVF